MAEPQNTENEQDSPRSSSQDKGPGNKFLPWVITILAVLAFAAAGFVIGRLFGTRGLHQTVSAGEQADAFGEPVPPSQTQAGPIWYYDLDSVVANLNEPGVTRYVRVGLTLEFGGTMSEKEGLAFLEKNKPLLKHWLTLYLSNQTIEDTRGEKNLLRMQTQISNLFNEGLFPKSKTRIKRVLFKELSIQ